jgi:hypothetical protein
MVHGAWCMVHGVFATCVTFKPFQDTDEDSKRFLRMGSNGYIVDGMQVQQVMTVSQSKSGNVWIYNTGCTSYNRSLLTTNTVSSFGLRK